MSSGRDRREELSGRVTDHVLGHGLIGLSLRPLAAALSTSDRMLIYHFGSKDDLVAEVLRTSNDRAVAMVRGLAPAGDVRQAVLGLWDRYSRPPLAGCQRTYVEAAALGLLGREPYVTVVGEANEVWAAAVADHLVASGVPRRRAARVTRLVDAAFAGFLLDGPLESDPRAVRRAVRDVADAAAAIAG